MIHIGEKTWNLRIYITDLHLEKTLTVRGDQHVGGLMLQIVESENPKDWSDHALWWPAKNIWLLRTRSTLDQLGVQANSLLHFTPTHKILRVQMPDLRYLNCNIDFSLNTFGTVVKLCKDLNIRYPEELSLCKPLEPEHLKKNFCKFPTGKIPIVETNGDTKYLDPAADTNTFIPSVVNSTLNKEQYATSPIANKKHNNHDNNNNNLSIDYLDQNLAYSPKAPSHDVRARLVRPRSLVEKARMNVGWLDSSLSIMEQGIREYETLCLRFKYYTFFDINPKYDQVRINQLFEQAKWSILNEELDCTEEESFMFAALQYHINHKYNMDETIEIEVDNDNVDDIDSALTELQITLEGTQLSYESGNITKIPQLSDYLFFLKPQKFTLKGYKRYFFTYSDLQLHLYKTANDSRQTAPILSINLRGCEVTPQVHLKQQKFAIRLEVPSDSINGVNSEFWLRCNNEEQYAKWLAACRLAAKGRSLADNSYESEVASILSLLKMQKPTQGITLQTNTLNLDVENYLAARTLRKTTVARAMQSILEAHANVKEMKILEAKLKYIQAWQSLPGFGVTLFVIKFDGHKKEQLLGVTHNRIMSMDLQSGDHIKTWRYNIMKAWNVNWGSKCMMIQFNNENVIFSCQSADCKVAHEFIGGYIFMSMRSKENNQMLNEELFHKLTGGWV